MEGIEREGKPSNQHSVMNNRMSKYQKISTVTLTWFRSNLFLLLIDFSNRKFLELPKDPESIKVTLASVPAPLLSPVNTLMRYSVSVVGRCCSCSCITTPHPTLPHHTTPHHTPPHHTTSHHTPPHHTTPHHITPHHTTPHHTTPHHTTPHNTIPHHTTPHHLVVAEYSPYF